jgi:hypothetical protein
MTDDRSWYTAQEDDAAFLGEASAERKWVPHEAPDAKEHSRRTGAVNDFTRHSLNTSFDEIVRQFRASTTICDCPGREG